MTGEVESETAREADGDCAVVGRCFLKDVLRRE